ncbi:hypothetical protein NDU88_005565 [Pleurodeles waltl]|uniref:Uncharacterized protein n=1 Tax=Pleurodeles waltl TaxID=8319 RepID=A0AAV7SM33_PLEWA|nr:hypothetical protein NDU88_005565 [Pleurodeles waltl]
MGSLIGGSTAAAALGHTVHHGVRGSTQATAIQRVLTPALAPLTLGNRGLSVLAMVVVTSAPQYAAMPGGIHSDEAVRGGMEKKHVVTPPVFRQDAAVRGEASVRLLRCTLPGLSPLVSLGGTTTPRFNADNTGQKHLQSVACGSSFL